MNIVPNRDLFFVFDDKEIRAMGAAFDQACRSLRHFAHLDRVRELVAKRIIEAAKNGECDPIRLHWQAVMGLASMKCRSLLIAYAAISPSRSTRRSRD